MDFTRLHDWRIEAIQRCVSILTLIQGTTPDSAANTEQALDDVLELGLGSFPANITGDVPRSRLYVEVRNALQSLYRHDDRNLCSLKPVQPDLLGEHVVALGLRTDYELLTRLFDNTSIDATNPLIVLDRTLSDRHDLLTRESARIALIQSLPRRINSLSSAIRQAALSGALNLVGNESKPGLIESQIMSFLSESECKDLRDIGSVHSARLLYLRKISVKYIDEFHYLKSQPVIPLKDGYDVVDLTELERRANDARKNSIHFGLSGDSRKAAQSAQTAVDLFREAIAGVDPEAPTGGMGEFLLAAKKGLASALNLLGNWLSDLGKYKQALAIGRESLQMHRKIYNLANPSDRFEVSSCLHNLANRYYFVGDIDEARRASLEATEIRRSLVIVNPEEYMYDYVNSSNNLSRILEESDELRAAVTVSREAIAIAKVWDEKYPDQFGDLLAKCYDTSGRVNVAIGNHDLAIKHSRSAVAHYERCFADNPSAYIKIFASTLRNLANRLLIAGKASAAVSPAEKAVNLELELDSSVISSRKIDLANALSISAKVQWHLGKRKAAIQKKCDAIRIIEAFAHTSRKANECYEGYLRDYVNWLEAEGQHEEQKLINEKIEALQISPNLTLGRALRDAWISKWNKFVHDQTHERFIKAEAARQSLLDFLREKGDDQALHPIAKEYERLFRLIKPNG